MFTGFIAGQIRRTNRNLLQINLLLALIAVGVPLLAQRYVRECLHGPTAMVLNDLARLPSAEAAPHSFVRVAIDPGQLDNRVYHISGGSDHKNDYYHFLHINGPSYLIIKANSNSLPDQLEGSIESASTGDVNAKVKPEVAGMVPGEALGVMLDTTGYRTDLYMMLGICIPLLALALWNIGKAIKRLGDPLRHPLARQLAKFGPPEEIAIAVDAEYQTSAQRTGRVITTTSWLLRPDLFGLAMVFLGDVVWAYKKEVKHKAYGVVTTSRTFSTVIHESSGRSREFVLNEKQVLGLLQDLAARVPWAIVGYNDALQAAWTKQRAQFLATIETRKQQAHAAAQAAAAVQPPPIQP